MLRCMIAILLAGGERYSFRSRVFVSFPCTKRPSTAELIYPKSSSKGFGNMLFCSFFAVSAQEYICNPALQISNIEAHYNYYLNYSRIRKISGISNEKLYRLWRETWNMPRTSRSLKHRHFKAPENSTQLRKTLPPWQLWLEHTFCVDKRGVFDRSLFQHTSATPLSLYKLCQWHYYCG